MAQLKESKVRGSLTWHDDVADSYGYVGVRTLGTTTTQGVSSVTVGNSLSAGTDGNAQGRLLLYGTTDKYGILYGPETANVSFYMPNTGGTLVTHATRGTAVGGGSAPIYIAASGRATAGRNNWAATTDHTINYASTITSGSGWVYYSRSSGLAILRLYGVYTPTAAVSAGTSVLIGTMSYSNAVCAPDTSYFGVIYRGVTGASRLGNAWVNTDNEIRVRFAADLTKGTAYGFYLTVPFRSDDAIPL